MGEALITRRGEGALRKHTVQTRTSGQVSFSFGAVGAIILSIPLKIIGNSSITVSPFSGITLGNGDGVAVSFSLKVGEYKDLTYFSATFGKNAGLRILLLENSLDVTLLSVTANNTGYAQGFNGVAIDQTYFS